MKIKTSELIDAALDWAVAKAEELTIDSLRGGAVWAWTKDALTGEDETIEIFRPSREWVQGGPIIEREKIATCPDSNYELRGGRWSATDWGGNITELAITPLVAAMRCYVASKLGDSVEIPDRLLT